MSRSATAEPRTELTGVVEIDCGPVEGLGAPKVASLLRHWRICFQLVSKVDKHVAIVESAMRSSEVTELEEGGGFWVAVGAGDSNWSSQVGNLALILQGLEGQEGHIIHINGHSSQSEFSQWRGW